MCVDVTEAMGGPPPRISVIVRSYNRLAALAELLTALLAQDHDSFEVVVVEQSTARPPEPPKIKPAFTTCGAIRIPQALFRFSWIHV